MLTSEAAREAYRYYYRQRYPLDTSTAGRGRRLSPLHGRLEELGAVFGTKNGWERADYFQPGQRWRRAGEDQRAFGWAPPPYLPQLAAEHTAFRERAGIIDLTSFGKIAVSGPGALPLLQRVCDNDVDRPAGRVVYTQFLDRSRRDRRRPDRHPAGAAMSSASSPAPARSTRTSAGCACTTRLATARSRSATSPTSTR